MGKLLNFFWKVEETTEDAIETIEDTAEGVVEKAAEAVQDLEERTVRRARQVVGRARHFLQTGTAGGLVLMAAMAAALIVANSPFYPFYDYVLNEVNFRIGFSDLQGMDLELRKSLLHWINDGLMAVFFFLIGLEIKRELLGGALASRERALLPAVAAIGGMAVPAAIFWHINRDIPQNLHGWAVPAATDIAFALGVLALLRHRVPTSLKILLTAIAVIDDLGAIVIIALFYSGNVLFGPLYFATGILVTMMLMSQRKVSQITPYLLLGAALWLAVLESGIHATLAGVVTAIFIPMEARDGHSPVKDLQRKLEPWVAFGVLPLFAFANAGVPLEGIGIAQLTNPVTTGIFLGLFVGKQVGIFSLLWLAVRFGFSPKPDNADWWQLYAVSVLCGIGFTMSLFIGELAYTGAEQQIYVRMGVLLASVLSAVMGYLILRFAPAGREQERVTVGGGARAEGK